MAEVLIFDNRTKAVNPDLTWTFESIRRLQNLVDRTGGLTGVIPAADISFTPFGDIAAINVQLAIEELDTEKQPKDATLTAFAAVVTAADKLVYATGVDTFSTTDFSAFARTLVDDANAAAARTTLDAEQAGTAAAAIATHVGLADPHTQYATDADLTAHTGNTSNPHSVTKAQVGLGNVDNTSDANKPISTATQAALQSYARRFLLMGA